MNRTTKPPSAFAPEARINSLTREEVVSNLKSRLQETGYALELALPAFGRQKLAGMMPEPDAAFSVRKNRPPEEQAVVAIHFAEAAGSFTYACTTFAPKGELAFERGRVNPVNGTIEVLEARGVLSKDEPGDF